jgi:hypothetical protein
MCTGKIVCNSFISVISGITLCNADDIAMYSAFLYNVNLDKERGSKVYLNKQVVFVVFLVL